MKAHNLLGKLKGRKELDFCEISKFNQGSTGVYWASKGISPWELHPNDDELLHVLEGKVQVEVLTDRGSIKEIVGAGSVFIVPKGHWHRQKLLSKVKQFFLTPGATKYSSAKDPRGRRK